MNKNIDFINDLIKIESNGLNDSEYLLSVYIPVENLNVVDVKKRIKSMFHKKKVLKDSVLKLVNSKIDSISDIKNGLAIFAKINLNKDEITLGESNLFIRNLLVAPESYLNLSKVFVLDQLIWAEQYAFCSIIINFNPENADFFILKDGEIKLIKQINNPLTEDRGKATSVSNTGMYYNMEETKINQEKLEMARGVLNKTYEEIKTNEENMKNDYDYFTVIYSSYFKSLIDGFAKSLQTLYSNSIKMVLINKNIEKEDEIKKVVEENIRLKNRHEKRRLLNAAKDKFQSYAEGWNKVIEAANDFKIRTLFIKNRSKMKGYVSNNVIRLTPIQGAKLVNNLTPWLLNNVLISGGEIVIFNKNDRVNFLDVAAQLRY